MFFFLNLIFDITYIIRKICEIQDKKRTFYQTDKLTNELVKIYAINPVTSDKGVFLHLCMKVCSLFFNFPHFLPNFLKTARNFLYPGSFRIHQADSRNKDLFYVSNKHT